MLIRKHTVRRLRTAASKYFAEDEDYRAFLSGFGVQSTLDLTEAQANEAIASIDRMAKKARRKVRQKREAANPQLAGRISMEQEEYIHGLFAALNIPQGIRQFKFIEKQVGTAKAPAWLSRTEAQKVITGLQQYKKYSGKQLTPKK